MLRIVGHSAVGKALFAALFLLLSALQPGLFAAANATGSHEDGGISFLAEAPGSGKTVQSTHGADHGDEASAGTADGQDHHGAKKSVENSCRVHCAPTQAVPVDCPDIKPVPARCFAPVVLGTLPLGEYTVHPKPPKHLI